MTYCAYPAADFAFNHVMGMAGVLDTARYPRFASPTEIGCSAWTSGSAWWAAHGDADGSLPIHHGTGIPVTHFVKEERLHEIIRTR